MTLDPNKLKSLEEYNLVKNSLAGSEIAWKQIVVRYKKIMKSAIKKHINKFNHSFDSEVVYDIYQDVLLKLHKNALNSFIENYDESKSSLNSFIYTVASNTAKDFTKSKLGQSSLQEINPDVSEENESMALLDLVAIDYKSTSDVAIDNEQKKILANEIVSLKKDKKEIISLYLSGEANKEIAKKIKRSESYVNKIIFNFKNYLNKKYKEVA